MVINCQYDMMSHDVIYCIYRYAIYVYTHIYNIHTYIYIDTYTHWYYGYVYIYTCIYIYIRIYINLISYIYIQLFNWYIDILVYVYTCIYLDMIWMLGSPWSFPKNQLPKGVEFASTAADSPRNAASGPRRVGGDPALEKVPRREKMFPDLARGE